MALRTNGRGPRRRRRGVALRPRGSEFLDLFSRAGANLQTTGELVHALLVSWPDQPSLRDEITRCEHEGDRLTRQIIERLHQKQATPFDGRDVYAVAEAIDDVIDEIEEVSEEMAVYDIEAPMEQAQDLAAVVRDSGRVVRRALDELPGSDDLSDEAREVRELEHEGDRIYREAIASLFEGGIDPMVILRWKDIFQGLEDAVDRSRWLMDMLAGLTPRGS
jgi:predicted phosphate transport protein (TIGR00153 family)